MKLTNFKIITDKEIDIEKYLKFYKSITDNLPDETWLGNFKKEIIEEIISTKGKIWIWLNENEIVCSIMYIKATEKGLNKLQIENINFDEIGECGAVLVNEKYRGNGLQYQMLEFFEEYIESINKKYILTTIHPKNIYSINNFLKSKYKYVNSIELYRGKRNIYIKEIKCEK